MYVCMYVCVYVCMYVCNVMQCNVMLCFVMFCFVMLCYVLFCYVMWCYVMLCFVMLCYVMLCMYVCMYAKQSYFAMSSNNEEPINNPKTQKQIFWAKIQNSNFRKNSKNMIFSAKIKKIERTTVQQVSFFLSGTELFVPSRPWWFSTSCTSMWRWLILNGNLRLQLFFNVIIRHWQIHRPCHLQAPFRLHQLRPKGISSGGRDLPRSMIKSKLGSSPSNAQQCNRFSFFLSKKGLCELASLVHGVLQFTRLQPRLSTVPITCDYLTSKKEGACSLTQFEIFDFEFMEFLDVQHPQKNKPSIFWFHHF